MRASVYPGMFFNECKNKSTISFICDTTTTNMEHIFSAMLSHFSILKSKFLSQEKHEYFNMRPKLFSYQKCAKNCNLSDTQCQASDVHVGKGYDLFGKDWHENIMFWM